MFLYCLQIINIVTKQMYETVSLRVMPSQKIGDVKTDARQ